MFIFHKAKVQTVILKSEKLLVLHINADFGWSTHIDQLSIELKKRIGVLRRIRKRVPKEKKML